MYLLDGNLLGRGFSLSKAKQIRFRTKHKFGVMPASTVLIHGAHRSVKPHNLLGDKWDIFDGDDRLGQLDMSNYLYHSISLKRIDGRNDVFKLEQQGYAAHYILSKSDAQIMSFDLSLNPFHLQDRYKINVFPNTFSASALEELMFYVGEILYRKVSLRSPEV
jgi:hypothetical protein